MNFLGKGLAFPFKIDKDGRLIMKSGAEQIKQSIRLILSTKAFERVMRPDFGSGLNEFVFKQINNANLILIRKNVEESLIKYEPRIEVLDIVVSASVENPGVLQIEINYKIREDNIVDNMVYPFYIQGGGG